MANRVYQNNKPPESNSGGETMKRIVRANLSICLFFLFFLVFEIYAQRPAPKETLIRGEIMYTLLKPGDIPAIFEPVFIGIQEADKFYFIDEPIIAVIDGDFCEEASVI